MARYRIASIHCQLMPAGPGGATEGGGVRRTVRLCARIDDAGAGVGKLGQLDAVLFAEQRFVMPPFFNAVDLNGLVALRGHAEVARVVKVDGQNRGLRLPFFDVLSLEELCKGISKRG